MRFSLSTLTVVVTVVAILLAVVSVIAREGMLREREQKIAGQLERSRFVTLPDRQIHYSTCFDTAPGISNLMWHSVRRRMSTRTICFASLTIGDGQVIPGDILAECRNLQIVDLRITHPRVDLSGLARMRHLRQLSLRGPCPVSFKTLARIPDLESVHLGLFESDNEPAGDFVRFATTKKLRRVSSNRVSDPMIAPLERALPDCRLLWLPPPY